MAQRHVHGGRGALEEVGEQAGVDVGLLVKQVELAAVGALGRQVVGQDLGLEALGQVVLQLELGVEAVGGRPCLGEGETCGKLATKIPSGRRSSRGVNVPVALSEYLPSIFPLPLICDILKLGLAIVVLTEPEIGPSWADFPLTLKLRKSQTSDHTRQDERNLTQRRWEPWT
jgi:hypothetical protein